MRIVEATVTDAAKIANIVSVSNIDVADEFGINNDNNPKHPSFYNKDWVMSDFARNEKYFLYMENGVSIGCVAFENPRPGVAYLNRLSVLPQYRHKGVGEELVHYIFKYAKIRDIQRISIGIIAENFKHKNWYLKLGFVEGDIKTVPHRPFDVQFMSAELKSVDK
jgi:N-acetylglutamate synthase-like GNAT family acetyltransferase